MPNEVTTNFAYLPFGGGRRKCIGDQFALFESIVGLSMLMRRFEFVMDPNAPPVGMTTGEALLSVSCLLPVVCALAVSLIRHSPDGPCLLLLSSSPHLTGHPIPLLSVPQAPPSTPPTVS